MKKKLLTLITVSLMIVFAGTLFAEDNSTASAAKVPAAPPQAAVTATPAPQTAGITINEVVEAIETAGIMGVKSIEFDDGQWEVKAQNGNLETKYVLQGTNLKQIGQEQEDDIQSGDFASMQAAIKAVQSKAYTVKGIDSEGNCWEIKAFDTKGQEYEILVNKDNGQIVNSKMDD